VVATDLAPGMVEAAQRRAADEGVENLRLSGLHAPNKRRAARIAVHIYITFAPS
jgi:hypothetical protein